jgi:hypothetical protein
MASKQDPAFRQADRVQKKAWLARSHLRDTSWLARKFARSLSQMIMIRNILCLNDEEWFCLELFSVAEKQQA